MDTIFILHGWQSSKEKWQKVKELIEKEGIKAISLDLPGFKPETELDKPWNLDDYVKWLNSFFQEKERTCPEIAEGFFLLGHSFGGRVAIKFAVKFPQKIKGLILVSSAGIKRDTVLKKLLGWTALFLRALGIKEQPEKKGIYQFFRKVFYTFLLRKTDYLNVSGNLKETMKNILAEDLTPILEKISSPTLIVWGKNDKITPLRDAFLMKDKIKNSKIEILKGIGHAPHLENPEALSQKIKEFVKSEEH